MPVHVGTSGWQYKDWAKDFYPPGTSNLLSFYSTKFRTVEINATFYRLPERSVFEKWAQETPDHFLFAVKASRFLTHMKKLKDPKEPVERLMERCSGLGSKLAVILVQLPGSFARNDERLVQTLSAFPGDVKVAVEFRHESWYDEQVRRLLARHDAALCLADRLGRLLTPAWRTSNWGYLRMHQGEGRPLPCYKIATLEDRAKLASQLWHRDEDVFVYFNNDTGGCAIRDAAAFASLTIREGMDRFPT
ncbi:MAG TPA: DUF72 domain-containing protein [Acidobacteriota bacterium]|jgi:uncharacterized protein YecE (DUF72 family)|nr:DUF72 domain-containing protein [Acidobacteriota bacterium]